jgi:alpha-glucosidase (family GH31 glycosyl hydrolase)
MDYVFPHQGFEKITDQFLLGDHIIIAPVVEEGLTKRKVVLPKGNWRDGQGKKYRGGRIIEINVSLESLPYFINEKSGLVI